MKPTPHESAHLHVTGRAVYVDDAPSPHGCLWVHPVTSPVAKGTLRNADASAARALPGVHAVLFDQDIPGDGLIGPIVHDEPLLSRGPLLFVGQPIAIVVAETRELAEKAAALVSLEIDEEPPTLTIDAAIDAQDFLGTPHTIARGDIEKGLRDAEHVVHGEMRCGGQDHFYLETQAALVIPQEDNSFHILSSTQHPNEIQKMAALVLGLPANQVVCEVPRMGGGFGGKESQATQPACWAALGAWATGRPCRVRFSRHQDMAWTGKRHPFLGRYSAGFTNGKLVALKTDIYCNGGWSEDLSIPILDRAMFHTDNAYFIQDLHFQGRACRTNLPSNTAFRGFGGPQGVLVVEDAINRFAESQGLDAAQVRADSFYREHQPTPYGQVLEGVRLQRIWKELSASSGYPERRSAAQGQGWVRSGIGFQPVKFGISFTASLLNQAGALVLVYADGSVQLNHGGTEMGQGLHSKMLKICAIELGVPQSKIRVMRTATDKVPNTSATAASSGTDLNGAAVRNACHQLRDRMATVRATMPGKPTFAQVALQCWVNQVSLAASGFYATPGIGYDRQAGRGTPFFYYAYGAAVCEVKLNALTGEYRLVRADILHDVGDSILPGVDKGQVEGGFVQGLGWLTQEELINRPDGSAVTLGPSTYKIPSIGDIPRDFHVNLLDKAPQHGVIHGSKAVGEPPFMLAIAALTALRHAISSFGPGPVQLAVPATPEAVLRAIAIQKGVLSRTQ